MTKTLTAIIERDGECYVALCPELDVASQGATVSEARHNLTSAWRCHSCEARFCIQEPVFL